MSDTQTGIAIRFIQQYHAAEPGTSTFDRAIILASHDPRGEAVSFNERLNDALKYIRLHTH